MLIKKSSQSIVLNIARRLYNLRAKEKNTCGPDTHQVKLYLYNYLNFWDLRRIFVPYKLIGLEKP